MELKSDVTEDDGVNVKLLKLSCPYIAKYVTHNLCLENGYVQPLLTIVSPNVQYQMPSILKNLVI